VVLGQKCAPDLTVLKWEYAITSKSNIEKVYHFSFKKLGRDKLTEVFSHKGITSVSHSLSPSDHKQALKTKLIEEAQEIADAQTSQELIMEIADVQEVLDALIKAYNISAEEIAQLRETKRTKFGGFATGLYIDYIEVPEGHTDLAYYLNHKEKYPQIR
jgi:predicted house-cleaning noncanonical NTP pyrophosphatase (MazG superfamily)